MLLATLLAAVSLRTVDAKADFSRAVFESCSGCKLNRLPELKRFLKQEVEAGAFGAAVTVKYIGGHNPDLVLYDGAGIEVVRIDITKYKAEELRHLLQAKGFSPPIDEL
eukprot:jgi/Chlat1/4873/Chrsp31S08941